MSCNSNTPNVNKTFIIEPLSLTGGSPTLSACTSLYTNLIQSCSGDTTITMGTGVVTFNSNIDGVNSFTANTIEANTYLSGGTNILDIVNGNDTFVTGGTFNDVSDALTLVRNDGANIVIGGLANYYVTGGTYNNSTGLISFDRNDTLSAFTVDLSTIDVNDTFVTGGTLVNTDLILDLNDGSSASPIDLSGLEFTGNTSATCISDIYVSNLHSCSPLRINPNDEGNVYFGSTSGITLDVLNQRVGIGTNTPSVELHVKGSASILRLETTQSQNSNFVEFHDPLERKGWIGYPGSTSSTDSFFIRNEEHGSKIIISTTDISGTSRTAINIDGNHDVQIPFGNFDVAGVVNIGTLGTGASINNLGIDSSGNVVVGTTGDTDTNTFVTGGTLSGNNLVLEKNNGVDVNPIDLSGLVSGKTDLTLFNTHTGDTNNPHQTSFSNLTATAHTHTLSEITDFNSYSGNVQTQIDGKTDLTLFNTHTGDTNNPHQTSFGNLTSTAHTHTISDVINLQNELDGKLNVSDFNTYSGNVQTELNTKISGATNLSSEGVFAQKNGLDLEFKGITSTGGTVNISSNSTSVNLEVTTVGSDKFVSGGTYNGGTKEINFVGNSVETTFDVDLTSLVSSVSGDTFVTGQTFSNSTYILSTTRNDGTTFNTDLSVLATDVYVLSGVYNPATGIVTYTNSTGGTFQVSGFTTGMTDSYTTAANLNGETIEFDNNIQGSNLYNVSLSPVLSGKTDLTLFNSHTGDTNNPHQTSFSNLTSTAHTHTLSDITDFNSYSGSVQTQIDSKLNISDFNTYSGNVQTQLDSKIEDAINSGGANEVFSGKSGTDLYFRTLSGGSNTTISTIDDIIRVDVTVPIDTNTFVTGGTYNPTTDIVTLTRNDAVTIDITGVTDTFTTGATYDNGTATATFTKNDGTTYSLDLSTIDVNDTFVTGATLNGNILELDRNSGLSAVTVDLSTITATTPTIDQVIASGNQLTDTNSSLQLPSAGSIDWNVLGGTQRFTISTGTNGYIRLVNEDGELEFGDGNRVSLASFSGSDLELKTGGNTDDFRIYLGTNGPSVGDILEVKSLDGNTGLMGWGTPSYLTGGTYSAGTLTLDNSDGTSVSVTGFTTGGGDNFYVTGFTYNDANTLTISRNGGLGDLSATINTLTGLTIDGVLSASTYTGLTLDGLDDVTTGIPTTPDNTYQGRVLYFDVATNEWLSTEEYVSTGTVTIWGKKGSAGTIAKGLPVYIVGFDNDLHEVELANASTGATMPVIGFTGEEFDNTNTGPLVTFGKLTGLDTTSTVSTLNPNGETWTVNDVLYMSTTTGGLTKFRPTGTDTQIQRIAKVLKVGTTDGQIFIFNTARTAGLPNLTSDYVWVGNGNDTPQEVIRTDVGITVTGFTYDDNNTFTITDDNGGSLSSTINTVSALTVTDYVDYTTTTKPTAISGRTYFDRDENALSYFPDTLANDVTINIGQESVIRVYNGTGSQINNGQACHIDGSSPSGGIPSVILAIATGNTSTGAEYEVSGIATHDIPNGTEGFITTFGLVRDLNITGVTEGTEIYLSDTTPGGLIYSLPTENSSRVTQLGWVVTTGATDGKILVQIENEVGYSDLSNTLINVIAENNASTGTRDGGEITINSGDNTLFDISAGSGIIVDNYTDPNTPTITNVVWDSITGVSVTNLTADTGSYIFLDSNLNTVQFGISNPPTESDYRDNIYLGIVGHTNFTNLTNVFNTPIQIVSPINQHQDLTSAIGPFSIAGNRILNIPGTLELEKTAGRSFFYGGNFHNDNKVPSNITTSDLSGSTLIYATGANVLGPSGTTVDPNNYDPNGAGVITPVPGTNQYVAHRIWHQPSSNLIIFQYGQEYYPNAATARDEFEFENYVVPSGLDETSYLVAILIARDGVSDLDSATIIPQGKFAGTGGGGGSVADTLQTAYDNSSSPEILTDATRGAVDFRVGSGSDSDNVVTFQQNSGTINAFVEGTGDAKFTNLTGTSVTSNSAINVFNGHINLRDNSYFLQGRTVADVNVSLIGVDSQDRVFVGNAGYDTYIDSDTIVDGTLSAQTAVLTTIPTLNNSATDILVRNSSTGEVEYRTIGGIISGDTFVTGGTFSSDTLTLDRNDGGSVVVTGFTSGSISITTVTGTTYSATSSDNVIGIDTTSNAVSLYLPDSVSSGTLKYDIKDIGLNSLTNNITIIASGSDTILTTSSVSSIVISNNGSSLTLVNNGSGQWWQI